MIKRKPFYKLNNEELNTLVSRILKAIAPIESFKTGVIARIIALVIGLNQQLTKSLNAGMKSEYSGLLKSLDTLRDNAFKAIRDSILGASNRLNETFQLHAKKLKEIFKRHGWSLWRENYQAETSKLNSLFGDLDEEGAGASLAKIGLVDWYNELKDAQANFEDAFQNKASGDLRKLYVTMQEIRPDLIKITNELLDQIDSLAKYGDNPEEYTELVSTINSILSETALLAKTRNTRKSNNEGEEIV